MQLTLHADSLLPLQVLNAYCDDLASGRLPAAARLSFFVHVGVKAALAVPEGPAGRSCAIRSTQNSAQQTHLNVHFDDRRACPCGTTAGTASEASLRRVEAALPARGSLAPLLHAFGLLSDAELEEEEAGSRDSAGEFLSGLWMHCSSGCCATALSRPDSSRQHRR